MENAPDDVLTVDDVAGYLRVPRSSIYKLAQQGVLRGRKVGKHWRFHRKAVEQWLLIGSSKARGEEIINRHG